ncbi:hypothetical protein P8452_63812 [Trifolium repens]|nr:hypothetical protein P8452_63812 [Trifolium repens]
MGRRKPRCYFKNIPMELQYEIFERLCLKDQSKAMCVSHSWRERILNTTLPKEKAHQSLGRKNVNIFSSENGDWTTLTLNLPEYIIKSCWIKKSIYSNGSVYRLSCSGHLIKIRVDPQQNVSEQAEIISLPPESLLSLLDNCHWELSVKGGKLLFVMSRGINFRVYELVECITRNVTSYSWSNIHTIEAASMLHLNTHGNLLSFHPYYEIAFFKLHKNLLYFFNISNNNIINIMEVPYSDILYDYLRCCHPPLLQCFKPFICCLNKENSGVFQRLPILP